VIEDARTVERPPHGKQDDEAEGDQAEDACEEDTQGRDFRQQEGEICPSSEAERRQVRENTEGRGGAGTRARQNGATPD